MPHSETVTAVLTENEPEDGAKLIVRTGGDWKVIVRDDTAAKSWDAADGDHWFEGDDGSNNDPMSLHAHLKYADAVYALGEQLATFN